MNINYKEAKMTSKTVDFIGETEDGKSFIITSNWNDWDDWTIDEISWFNDDGTEEEEAQIREQFMSEMN
jgi:hypothetical protein